MPGQGREQVDQVVHDWPGPPIVVAEDRRVAADALDHRGQIGRPMLLSEDHQVGLPMAEDLPVFDGLRAVPDHAALWEDKDSRLARVARLALAPPLGKITGKLLCSAIWRVDVAVDSLVADAPPRALMPHAPGNLLRRPAGLQCCDHAAPQVIILQELSLPLATVVGQVLSVHVPVARRHRHLRIAPEVAPDLAVDRRAVPAELHRNLRHADLALQHARNDAALGESEMRCQVKLLDPRKPSKSWLVAFQDRTHP